MTERKAEELSVEKMLDRKLRKLRFAQMEWDLLWPSLNYVENDCIVLFPEDNREVNIYGMKYLDTYLQRRCSENAIILTSDSFVKKTILEYSEHVKKVIYIEKEKMERFIGLYELYIFAPNLVVVSLQFPFCRNALGQIGIKHTTVEQLIAIGVYSILPFRPLGIGEKLV